MGDLTVWMYENISALLILSNFTVKRGGQIRITHVFLEGTGGIAVASAGVASARQSRHMQKWAQVEFCRSPL